MTEQPATMDPAKTSQPGSPEPKGKPSGILFRLQNLLTLAFEPRVTARRQAEAKALLFGQLALAVKNKADLVETVRLIGIEEQDRTIRDRLGKLRRVHPSYGLFVLLSTLALIPLYFFWIVILFAIPIVVFFLILFLNERSYQPNKLTARIARRLHRLMARGYSLSSAMENNYIDFTPGEISLIAAGTNSGCLGETLQGLSTRLFSATKRPKYSTLPFFLGYLFVIFNVCGFIIIFIVPKFVDIYNQLGANLPLNSYFTPDTPNMLLLISSLFLIALTTTVCNMARNGSHLVVAVVYLAPSLLAMVATTDWEWPWITVYYILFEGDYGDNDRRLLGLVAFAATIFFTMLVRMALTMELSNRIGSGFGIFRSILYHIPWVREWAGIGEREINILRTLQVGYAGKLPEEEIFQCLRTQPPLRSAYSSDTALIERDIDRGRTVLGALIRHGIFTGPRLRRLTDLRFDTHIADRLFVAIEDIQRIQDMQSQRRDDIAKIVCYVGLFLIVLYFNDALYSILNGMPGATINAHK